MFMGSHVNLVCYSNIKLLICNIILHSKILTLLFTPNILTMSSQKHFIHLWIPILSATSYPSCHVNITVHKKFLNRVVHFTCRRLINKLIVRFVWTGRARGETLNESKSQWARHSPLSDGLALMLFGFNCDFWGFLRPSPLSDKNRNAIFFAVFLSQHNAILRSPWCKMWHTGFF